MWYSTLALPTTKRNSSTALHKLSQIQYLEHNLFGSSGFLVTIKAGKSKFLCPARVSALLKEENCII
jgi:hypothetical protein